MPFQSEKQRRYLWANEPEIARDWADTYGSRIEKNDGGIMRVGFKKGDGPAGGASAGGNYDGDSSGGDTQGAGGGRSEAQGGQFGESYGPGRQGTHHGPTIKSKPKLAEPSEGEKKLTFSDKIYQYGLKRNKVEALRQLNLMRSGMPGLWGKTISALTGQVPEWAEDLTEDELMQIATSGPYLSQQKTKGDVSKFGRGKDLLGRVTEGEGLLKTGKLTQAEWERLFPGNVNTGGSDGQPIYPYPRDVHSEVIEDTEVVEDTPSAFQESLTGTADTPDYYVGDNPLASNLAWGESYGVDPRTMGRTSWAADGGRIPAAFGGIMDSSTGRRAYGLGSIFKSIGKAAKKVFKSPIGKAALLGGLGWAANAGHLGSWGTGILGKKGFLGKYLTKDNAMKEWSLGKLGLLGATAAPFFMGGKEEDEDEVFDYMGAKNAYADEIMRIKRGVNAGSLDPNKFSYLPSDYTYTGAEGGRAGYYAGGQSIPSPYTMEDARKSSMQDKMGGITDDMKRADLARQGDVGQMYMAQGGRIGYATGGGRPEEGIGSLDFVDKIVSPEAKALAGESKYSGDASDYREPERDTLLYETIYDRDTDTRDWRFQEDPWKLDGKDVGGLHTRETLDASNKMLDIQEDKKLQLEKMALKKGWSKKDFDRRLRKHVSEQGEVRTAKGRMENLNQAFNQLAYELGVWSNWEGDQDPQSLDMRLQDPNYRSKYVSGNAQGGRIGYQGGGETGYPPVTMGQVPQAPPQMPTPQAPPSPMPAPQPNQMAGMNPMMGRMNPMMGRMNPMMAGMNPMMGGRARAEEGGLMDLGGMEKDYRNDGGFVPLGGEEKADDVPARLSKNEFVFTADAVRGAGGGDIDKGAEIMENIMTNLEQGGQISEETQGLSGAQEMFDVSERIGEVI